MFVEDHSAFFADFGVSVDILGRSVRAIFDNAFELGAVGASGMASTQPSLLCSTADIPPRILNWFAYLYHPRDPVDLGITVNGEAYTIAAVEPDGTGMSRLLLERAT